MHAYNGKLHKKDIYLPKRTEKNKEKAMQLKTHSNYYWSASFLSNFRRQLRKPTFQVKLHVEEDFCDRLVSLSPVPPRCR